MFTLAHHGLRSRRGGVSPAGRRRGAVLLEVVLALVLFVAAAAIITGGISASMDGVDRLRYNAQAVNLAASVLAEIQIGARSVAQLGPEAFEAPFESWSWELTAEPVEDELPEEGRLTRVEVVVRHEEQPIVYRLTQMMRLESASGTLEGSDASLSP